MLVCSYLYKRTCINFLTIEHVLFLFKAGKLHSYCTTTTIKKFSRTYFWICLISFFAGTPYQYRK